MLIAAFAFAGHYIGRNASAHTAEASIVSVPGIPSLPQTTELASKSSLLPESETFQSAALAQLRKQTVQPDGKGDLFVPDSPRSAMLAETDPAQPGAKKKGAKDKLIHIEPASINLKAEQDVSAKAVKRLALAAENNGVAIGAPGASKSSKKQELAKRRIQLAEENCLARAVYFEARSESEMGQLAVAKVILNRTKNPAYPKTICGVVYQGSQRRNSCQFSFACDGLPDDVKSPAAWARSKRIAQKAISGDVNMGSAMSTATNYHADYVKPRWAKSMRKLVKIGTHIFYTNG
ncbi:MAG: cell wall hydrolase [Rhizobiales bacterium]|nr:cell wall hydrolase [Hyphomicrobiales bacterium]